MRRIFRYFRARQFECDLTDEIQSHLDEKRDDLISDGVAPAEACTHALRAFGNRATLLEACREKWAFVSLEEIVRDVVYALRTLRKSPLLTAVAVSSLAIGIGANTIIFSCVNHVLLRSPYPQPERLFAAHSRSALHGAEPLQVSAADFYDWRRQAHSFESLSAYASWPMNLTNVEEPRRLETELVSADFFATLGSHAQLGRTFAPDEDREQSASVIVISHHLWRLLGESSPIVGRQLTLNGSPATVIGVMPATFAFPLEETDAWVPLSMSAQNRANREGRWLSVIGRLAGGATRREATAEMDVITSQLAIAYPATNAGWTASLIPLQEELAGKTRPILLTLQAGSLLLLLIACANLANLLLARGAARGREIGMRLALGAGRARILRQLIIESVVLAVIGGGVGLGLATAGIRLMKTLAAGLIPQAEQIRFSPPVALFALAATLLTALIFGLAPALDASRVNLRATIGSGSRGTPHNLERKRGLLVAIEIAVASILLVGASLLGETLVHLLGAAPGLRTDHVLTMRLTLPRSKYPTSAAQGSYFQQVLDRVRTLPGIVAAGQISDTPLKGNNPTFEFLVRDAIRNPSDPPIQAGLRAIDAGYFQTAGIPLLQGRDFTLADRADRIPVAIVNETMARRWPKLSPLGQTVRLKDDPRWITIAGVVPDIKHMGLKADEGPVVYIPYAQKTQDWLAWTTLLMRTAGEPLDFVPAVRSAILGIDKNQPLAEIGTLDDTLARSVAVPRFTTLVIGAISSFAVLIAIVGVYGLLAYTVARRMPELGIRLTLGASPLDVFWLLFRQAMLRVLAGLAMGLLISWWAARLLGSLLFEIGPHDPATFAGVAGLLFLASLAALLAPARRAMKIDPAMVLRAE